MPIKCQLSSSSVLHLRMMIQAFVLLILVIATNYSMLGFICHGLYVYGAWLNENHRVDLWLLRVLVSMITVEYLHSQRVYSIEKKTEKTEKKTEKKKLYLA